MLVVRGCLMASALALSASVAVAQEPQAAYGASTSVVESQNTEAGTAHATLSNERGDELDVFSRDRLTGDWWGACITLEDHGFTFRSWFTEIMQAPVSGGGPRKWAVSAKRISMVWQATWACCFVSDDYWGFVGPCVLRRTMDGPVRMRRVVWTVSPVPQTREQEVHGKGIAV